ncbi:MAG: threonine/serine exporter family protein [Phycisphaeraceae bacterium]|nr:threonine/serine exporter family protein [Phycisphaeraceae bacterium]
MSESDTPSTPPPTPPPHTTSDLLEFLYRLGQAYLACGEQTAQVELQLRRVASAYGTRAARIVAFPTALFITLHDGTEERVTLAEGPLQPLRLDQMADVYTLGSAAQKGEVPVKAGIQRISEIVRTPARFGAVGGIVGHTILSVGIAMVLNPALINVGVAAVLGAFVGMLKVMIRSKDVLAVPLPVITATVVSAMVFFSVSYGLQVNPLHVLVPALVTFLPGAMLTFGMIELAYGDMVSGTSRLITGFVQLFLLAFGIAAGAAVVGVNPALLPEIATQTATIRWAAWVGVLTFGVGVFLHFSAPRNSLPWILLVLMMAFVSQRVAANVFATQFSGFFGTLVATPLGYLIQLRFRGPPPMITFLPSFWLLVPGALGLLSVKQMLSEKLEGIEGLITTVFVFASVALGTLLGAALYKWATEMLGTRQLQIGRATKKQRL